jgi:hypothetical protein
MPSVKLKGIYDKTGTTMGETKNCDMGGDKNIKRLLLRSKL